MIDKTAVQTALQTKELEIIDNYSFVIIGWRKTNPFLNHSQSLSSSVNTCLLNRRGLFCHQSNLAPIPRPLTE